MNWGGVAIVIGATTDKYFHAFDRETGDEVWKRGISFNENSVPSSYRRREDSKQFVVVAAGGNLLTHVGDSLLAFALPD